MSPRVFDPRVTEHRNPRTESIDLASPIGIVDLISAEDEQVAGAVRAQRLEIARAIEIAEASLRAGGRLLYAGAGTSGRLGVLDAAECPPTFGTDPSMVVGIIAGGSAALTAAVEGAEDSPTAAIGEIDARSVSGTDFLVGIAASGTTPFVLAALRRARERGARTGIVSCTPPTEELRALVDVAIIPVVGPEAITGSTRMKAGTATKMVLNMISTGAMIRIGKTYSNLMVDLRATNAKLADRSRRIIMELCDLTADAAEALLRTSGGSVKIALVMHLLHVDRSAAVQQLESAGGVIRRIIPAGIPDATP